MHKRNALQTELPAHLTGVSKLIFRTYYLQNHSYYQHLSAICYRQKNNNVASKQERRPQEAPSQINCPINTGVIMIPINGRAKSTLT
jgi:hypothetical protein